MRQDERFFLILEILGHARVPVPAEALAKELEVTTRSVHRDIAELVKQGSVIQGGASTGYSLDHNHKRAAKTPEPARAARELLDEEQLAREQIRASLPKLTRVAALDTSAPKGFDVARAEEWIRSGYKLRLQYGDAEGRCTKRTVWPVEISPSGKVRLVAAWCELRQGFRQFRTDRMLRVEFVEERFSMEPKELKSLWDSFRF